MKELAFISIILFLLLLCFFNDVFFHNKTLKSSVTIAQALDTGPYGQDKNNLRYISYADNTPGLLEEPYLKFKKDTFADGVFPLWNPHQACGMPFLAAGQSSLLFPLDGLLYVIPDKYAWDFYIIFRLFLAGIFTFYLMRLLGYLIVPSIIAAVAYMFSGPMITWMVNVTTNTNMLIPLLLICVEKVIREQNRKWITISSLVVGMVILTGHVEYSFFAFLTAAFYFVFRLIFMKNNNRFKILKSVFIILLLGLLFSSAFILPCIEYIFLNGWTTHDNTIGLISEEKGFNAITILIPYFFQKVLLTNEYKRAGWMGGYIGIMVTLLGLIGAVGRDKNKNNIIFVFIALFVILKCYGVWLVNWVGYLPIFNKIRYSWNYTQNFAFSMAILSGVGLNRLIESKKHLLKIALPSLFIMAIILGYLFYCDFAPDKVQATKYAFILLALVISMSWVLDSTKALPIFLGVLLTMELFYLMPKEHAQKYDAFPKVPYIEFLKKQEPRTRSFGTLWTLFPNTATGYRIDDLGIFEGIFVDRFTTYVREFLNPYSFRENSFPALRTWLPNLNSPFLDLLNVGYIIAPRGPNREIALDVETIELIYSKEVNIYKRRTAFPRVFVAHSVLFAKDQREAIDLMKANSNNLRDVVIVEGERDDRIVNILETVPLQDNSQVQMRKYMPNYIEIDANFEHPGFLVFSDTYYPGWKVAIDGKRSKLFISDLMLRAVFVEKGHHAIKFYFRPITFILGAVISSLTAITLIVSLVYKRR